MRHVLDEVMGQLGLSEIADVRQLGTGSGSGDLVYCVNDRYVVRLGTGPDGQCFPQAVAVLRAIKGRLAAPRVLYADLSRARHPFHVMVCGLLPGQPLAQVWSQLNRDQIGSVVAQVASQLQILHTTSIPDMPHFARASQWPQALLKQLRELLAAAQGRSGSVDLGRIEGYVGEHQADILAAPPAVVLHNDLNWSNVLVQDGHVTGLIDFDDVEAGPAEIDAWGLVHMVALADKPHLPSVAVDAENLHRAGRLVRTIWPEPFAAPGVRHRYVLWHIREVLWNLTHVDIWQTQQEARDEAEMVCRAIFEQPGFGDWGY